MPSAPSNPPAQGSSVPPDWLRVAHRLIGQGKQRVGLLSAVSDLELGPLVIDLGAGLAQLSGASVVVIDAAASWPVWSTPSPDEGRMDHVRGRWTSGGTVLLAAPLTRPGHGEGAASIEPLLRYAAPRARHVVVDLAGLQPNREHLSTLSKLDGALVVVRAGATREKPLLELTRDLPEDKNLGVLLLES